MLRLVGHYDPAREYIALGLITWDEPETEEMNTSSSSKGKREIDRLSFEPAKGGVIARASFRTQRGGQGGGPSVDYDDDAPSVHADMESVIAHVRKHLGKHLGEADSTADGSPDRETRADKE